MFFVAEYFATPIKMIMAITRLIPTATSVENPSNNKKAIKGASVIYRMAAAGRQSLITTTLSIRAFRGAYADQCPRVNII
jgi:hypothetical protein